MRASLLLAAVLGAVLATSPAGADTYHASNFGQPLTLNSANYAPDSTGYALGAYDGQCTAQLVLTSGTISVNVEGALTGAGAFANLGTLSTSGMVSIQGPIEYLRFNVTSCSSCLATAILRCRVGD